MPHKSLLDLRQTERAIRMIKEYFQTNLASALNLLRVSGRCIAAQFCLRVDRSLYILKIGYDESYSRLAPGNMLLEYVLRRCDSERDIDIVNLASGAAWHADWKPAWDLRNDAMVFNNTVRGRIAYVLVQAKELACPLYRKYVGRRMSSAKMPPTGARPKTTSRV